MQTQERERERSLWPPPPYSRRHGQGQEGSAFEFIEDGVPCVCPDGELRVVETVVGISALSFYLEALANEEILLKGVFIFFGESRNYLWFLPFNGAGGAVTGMFRNTRDIFIWLGGGCVGSVLAHTSAE